MDLPITLIVLCVCGILLMAYGEFSEHRKLKNMTPDERVAYQRVQSFRVGKSKGSF